MCNPVAIAGAGLAFDVFSAFQQGQAKKGVARFNARQAKNDAIRTRNKGVEEENKQREQLAQLQSRQRVQLGAANVDLTSGTPLQLQQDAALFGEVDALRIRSNFQDRADVLDQSAVLTSMQGDNAATAGRNEAIGTLLSGGGKIIQSSGVSSRWYNPNSAAVSTTSTGEVPNTRIGSIE